MATKGRQRSDSGSFWICATAATPNLPSRSEVELYVRTFCERTLSEPSAAVVVKVGEHYLAHSRPRLQTTILNFASRGLPDLRELARGSEALKSKYQLNGSENSSLLSVRRIPTSTMLTYRTHHFVRTQFPLDSSTVVSSRTLSPRTSSLLPLPRGLFNRCRFRLRVPHPRPRPCDNTCDATGATKRPYLRENAFSCKS